MDGMTAPAQSPATHVTQSGRLEVDFVGGTPDPHAKAIERIRLIAKPEHASNEQLGDNR